MRIKHLRVRRVRIRRLRMHYYLVDGWKNPPEVVRRRKIPR